MGWGAETGGRICEVLWQNYLFTVGMSRGLRERRRQKMRHEFLRFEESDEGTVS